MYARDTALPMRSVFVGLMLAATVLAGCASQAPTDAINEIPEAVFDNGSHPMFGYLTSAVLREGNASDFPAPGQFNGSNPPGVDAWMKPMMRPLPGLLNSMAFEARADMETGTNGIAIFGPLAFAGSGGTLSLINIMDPTNPHVVSTIEAPGRDVDTILYPDGRLVAVVTSGGGTITLVDATDPYNPEVIGTVETPNGNHNLAVVPGTPIIYNSPSDGSNNGAGADFAIDDPTQPPNGKTDIIDASDPTNPVLVKTWENGYGCHDVAFLVNQEAEKMRGYCAGIQKVQIWNVTDPLNPEVVSEWGWPAGGVHDGTAVSLASFAHLAIPNHDGTILILGDESGGGAAPGCDFSVNAAGTTATGPLGNLWFYDVSDESNPVLKGSYSPSAYEQRGSCTAHFGKVIEDTSHVVMGFYSAGVVLVNFEDPQNPYMVDRYARNDPIPGSEAPGGAGTVWDVQYYQGYLFTGDTQNGVDVLTLN